MCSPLAVSSFLRICRAGTEVDAVEPLPPLPPRYAVAAGDTNEPFDHRARENRLQRPAQLPRPRVTSPTDTVRRTEGNVRTLNGVRETDKQKKGWNCENTLKDTARRQYDKYAIVSQQRVPLQHSTERPGCASSSSQDPCLQRHGRRDHGSHTEAESAPAHADRLGGTRKH